MGLAGCMRAVGLGLGAAAIWSGVAAEGISAYQGAWLEQSLSCDLIFAGARKGISFKKPVNIFAPAFIISGNRLSTPQASCRIKSIKPTGDREVLALDCANSVSVGALGVIMKPSPDGTLKRYFDDQDLTGNAYRRCSL